MLELSFLVHSLWILLHSSFLAVWFHNNEPRHGDTLKCLIYIYICIYFEYTVLPEAVKSWFPSVLENLEPLTLKSLLVLQICFEAH